MKKLVFADGTSIKVCDESTAGYICINVKKFADIDPIKAKFTRENLKAAQLNEEKLTDIIPEGLTITVFENDIKVVFSTREMTFEERVQKQITELQEAVTEVAEIAGGQS